jgi:hypothetical protein
VGEVLHDVDPAPPGRAIPLELGMQPPPVLQDDRDQQVEAGRNTWIQADKAALDDHGALASSQGRRERSIVEDPRSRHPDLPRFFLLSITKPVAGPGHLVRVDEG